MQRLGILAVIGLLGCSVDASDGMTGFGGSAPGDVSASAGGDGDEATGSDDGEDGEDAGDESTDGDGGGGTFGDPTAETGDEPGSTSASTFNPLDDGGGGGGGSGDPGWWDFCLSDAACQAGFRCLIAEDMSAGFCSADCGGGGDPSTCGDPGSGDAPAICITVSGNPVCALDCSGGQTCPDSMSCVPEIDENGPITICM